MVWTIDYLETARRGLRKLDRQAARRVVDFMDERVASVDDPRSVGKALSGPRRQYWRYRVGDYRIVCDIQDRRLVILVVEVGHRSEIYR